MADNFDNDNYNNVMDNENNDNGYYFDDNFRWTPNTFRQFLSTDQPQDVNDGRWNTRFFGPWYSDEADYNTNAKSYYDYLARVGWMLSKYNNVLNALLRREISVMDTNTIHMIQDGNWEQLDDIHIKSFVKLSKEMVDNHPNGILANDDGIFTKDFTNDINNINEQLKALEGRYVDIPTDMFDVKFYNGFYGVGGKPVTIGMNATRDFTIFNFKVHAGQNTVKNDNPKNIKFSHTNPVSQVPQSYIFGVTFKDEFKEKLYSHLNSTAVQGNNVWNVLPRKSRASWTATPTITQGLDGNDVMIGAGSYSDGFNEDFNSYDEDIKISSLNLSISGYFYKE